MKKKFNELFKNNFNIKADFNNALKKKYFTMH